MGDHKPNTRLIAKPRTNGQGVSNYKQMPTAYTSPGYVRLLNVTYTGTQGAPGSQLNWNTLNLSDLDTDIVDQNDDGNLDQGVDDWFGGVYQFTGYAISSGGVDYGVFSDGSLYYVPINENGFGQTTIGNTGSSNAFQGSDVNAYLCFALGSLIETPDGERAVETLKIGDLVRTATGSETKILWVGRQSVAKYCATPTAQPVRIRAGALGNDLPHADLTVTADHGMVIDGYVINASALVNNDTIDFVPVAELPEQFAYYHIETENHDVILANGAATETFVDAAGRAAFDNYQEYLDLYGAERIIPEMRRPRISSQRLLPDAIKTRLNIAEEQIFFDLALGA
jgi:hypothetical protein